MARKTLHEFVAPFADNVPVRPEVNMGDGDFDMKTSLMTMARASLMRMQVLISSNS
jgi:hypothetical protein